MTIRQIGATSETSRSSNGTAMPSFRRGGMADQRCENETAARHRQDRMRDNWGASSGTDEGAAYWRHCTSLLINVLRTPICHAGALIFQMLFRSRQLSLYGNAW